MTRGERVCKFISTYCLAPEGDHIGKPITLQPFQKRFLLDIYDNPHGTHTAYLSIGRKNGKGLALDTLLPTPNGWKRMGELREGDTLFDENGKPCVVQFLSPIHIGLRCWRLVFSDGSSVVADEQHRWLTTTDRRRGPTVTTTPEIAEQVRKIRKDGGVEFKHSIKVAGALKSTDVPLPVDPYLLGCWLGDGHSNSARLTCGDEDIEHFARAIGDGLSLEPVKRKDAGKTAWTLGFSAGRGGLRSSTFQVGLRSIGVLGNKHIPENFLWAGTEQRRALLQGLMDTDGTVVPTGHSGAVSCGFSACNELLARQTLTLVRSLGMKATIRSRPAKLNGVEVNTVWEIQFTAWADDAVFRLPRKLQRLKHRPVRQTRSSSVQIVSCEEVDSVPTRCIQVSSASSLFLCGEGMVPTHNTALIAAMLLAHLVGPEAVQNSQIISGAQSKEQAAVVFELARKMVEMSPKLSKLVRVQPSGKRLIGLARNVLYRALAAEGKTAHGLSPILAILDEVGQVQGPTSPFVEAIVTAQGAYTNPLLIAISTQAPTDADLFSTWLDAQQNSPDPRVVSHVYSAPKDMPIDDRKGWAMANPALGIFRSLADVEKQYERALQIPANEPGFRNLILNQRVEASAPFVSRSTWEANGESPGMPGPRTKVWAGLDLSSVNDLTALVAVDETGGVHPSFWLPAHGLTEKSRQDKVPYDIWAKEKFLNTTPGPAIEYEYIAEYLRAFFDQYDVQAVAFDRALFNFLTPWLDKAGFSSDEMEKFKPFGQGTMSMTPALRELEVRLLNKKLRHGNHPVLSMCMANAKVVGDSGARKFDKKKARGRIDGAVALAMAIGVMPMEVVQEKKYQMLFF